VAKRFILEAIRLDSGNVHYWSTLAGLEAVEGAWGQSLEAAEQGLALEAQDATCAQLRASALIALGRAAEARQVAAGVLAEDPEDAAAHLRLGWFDLGHGRRDAAERHFRETLRREPKNVAAAWALRNARLARFVPYLLAFRVVFWVSGGMPGLLVATFGALLGVTCWVAFRHDGLIVQRHLGWIALAEGIGCLVLFRPVFTLFLLFDPASRRRVPLRHRVAAVAVGAIAVAALCVWLERMTRPNRP
jgi:tetratricopeptide (TPR) repeat protein